MNANAPQDPFGVLTRQLDGPDLDCLVSKAALLLRLQVYHLTLGRPVNGRRHLGVRTGRHVGCEGESLLCDGFESIKGMVEEVEAMTK
jgi:hypothetical protein